MRVMGLTIMAGAIVALMAPQAFAQSIAPAPAPQLAVAPARAKGAELRRVTPQNNTHLAYEYETSAGPSRLSVDPTSLVSDIEKARKRGAKVVAVKHVTTAAAQTPVADAVRPEIIQAVVVTEPDVAPAPRGERKVRVIPLYHTPNLD